MLTYVTLPTATSTLTSMGQWVAEFLDYNLIALVAGITLGATILSYIAKYILIAIKKITR